VCYDPPNTFWEEGYMIKEAHILLLRWAAWERIPIGYCGAPSWSSTTITAKLMEGKGEFLPGPPRNSGPRMIPVDRDAMVVDKFIRTLPKTDKELIKLYYLQHAYTVDEKAMLLKISKKKLYSVLHVVHTLLLNFSAPNVVSMETKNM